ECEDEVSIEIDGGTFAETWLQKRLHLFPALACGRSFLCLALIEPRDWSQVRERHSSIVAGNLETHRRLFTDHDLFRACACGRRSELDRDTLRVESLRRFILGENV